MITRNFNLYLNAGHSVPLVINVNQYDSGEQWVFTLYNADGTKYTPSTGAIVGIKSDGLGIINSGSVVDGNVVINETQQMTAAVGKAVFELLIDSQTHGTANFVVLVEEKPGNNADLSESDISMYQSLLNIAPSNSGSVGQVLTRTATGAQWANGGGGGGGSVTVDTALSTTSENPVQNKVITNYLDGMVEVYAMSDHVETYFKLSNGYSQSIDTPIMNNSYKISNANLNIDSSITSGGTNAVNSTAVIAYINSLDASNTSY